MKTSQTGVDLIKSFEGCRLTAYKPVASEKYWTIGYGHYGADVIVGMTISQTRAEELLKGDLERFERAVTKLGIGLNQNQFDALVSFAYNCGEGNLKKLCAGRTKEQIAQAIPLYNKGADKKVLAGLVRRRAAEQALFLKGTPNQKTSAEIAQEVLAGNWGNGTERREKLTAAGYDYSAVQKEVNRILRG